MISTKLCTCYLYVLTILDEFLIPEPLFFLFLLQHLWEYKQNLTKDVRFEDAAASLCVKTLEEHVRNDLAAACS